MLSMTRPTWKASASFPCAGTWSWEARASPGKVRCSLWPHRGAHTPVLESLGGRGGEEADCVPLAQISPLSPRKKAD